MSGVRDPAFWKRFSVAVHMDEEAAPTRPDLKHSDSWLARQHRKKSRRTWVCWAFWILIPAFVAGVIIAVIWVLQSGLLQKVKIGNGNGTVAQPADPNGNTVVGGS
nr:hypothetical protein B0A51_02461 [Rachicladosporium sp. CCFEE 5018]